MTFSPNKKAEGTIRTIAVQAVPFGVQDGVQAIIYIVID
jgi:hypothetical protein